MAIYWKHAFYLGFVRSINASLELKGAWNIATWKIQKLIVWVVIKCISNAFWKHKW